MRFDAVPPAAEGRQETNKQPDEVPGFSFQEKYSGDDVKQHGRRSIFLLDLFCGTAGVAAAFKSLGGESMGIDHMVDKRRVKGPVSKVDLARKENQSTVLS